MSCPAGIRGKRSGHENRVILQSELENYSYMLIEELS